MEHLTVKELIADILALVALICLVTGYFLFGTILAIVAVTLKIKSNEIRKKN